MDGANSFRAVEATVELGSDRFRPPSPPTDTQEALSINTYRSPLS